MSATIGQQLTFAVCQHPAAARLPSGGWLEGALTVGGELRVERSLQPGDRLTVTVADADGEIVATGEAEIAAVAFTPIKIEGDVVGTTRVHKAKTT